MSTDITNPIYTNENAARKHLEKLRWGEQMYCPLCGCTDRIKPTTMKNKPTATPPLIQNQ